MQRLEGALGGVRSKWISVRVGEGIALLLAFGLLGLVLAFGLDNLLHLSLVPRLVLTVGILGGAGTIAATRILSPLLRRPSDDAVALLIERGRPEMENRLINAVQLTRETLPEGSVGFAQLVRQDATECLSRIGVRGVVPVRFLKRVGLVAGVGVGAFVAYAVLLPSYFKNAVQRFAEPTRFVAPITETTLSVEPGNTRIARGGGFTVVARVGGVVPSKAVLKVRGAVDGDYEMQFRGDSFAFDVSNVAAEMKYRVVAGDAESEAFRVTVVDPPRVERLVLETTSPSYARRPVQREDPAAGQIRAIPESLVRVEAHANRPLAKASLRLGSGTEIAMAISGDRVASVQVRVTQRDSYAIVLVDEEGVRDPAPPVHPIEPLPAGPPTVEVREPGRDIQVAATAGVPLSIVAKDDVGLARVELLARVGKDGKESALAEWTWPDVKQEVTLGHLLKLVEQKLAAGATLSYCARAVNLKGEEARSRAFTIAILSQEQEKQQTLTALATLRDRLHWILEKQKQARAEAGTIGGGTSEKQGLDASHRVRAQQFEVRQQSLALLADWKGEELAKLPGREKLAALAADEMSRANEAAEAMERDQKAAERFAKARVLLPIQDRIIEVIDGILKSVQDVIARVKSSNDASAAVEKAAEDGDVRKKLEAMAADLEKFLKEQKKVIQQSQEMEKKKADDFSDLDKEKLNAMKAAEEKWGKFLQEAATDLSKLPPQDFSNGSTAKDAVQAASEVELAANSLNQKNVELAVPQEQSGLELAQEITTNIERWLADSPDHDKWNMEEATQDFDVPMADLPQQLEDLMGDLIDKEEDMSDETEDVTSSWMDSMDKGAGWGAMDGPISNMSAKGVTGNLLPNNNEIGGRSGEGRSGKSSGQMVGDEAVGKGGRQTPSRSTPDPYEKGQVKDSNKDPTGGSTGGGKMSGVNQAGLRGNPPPETMQKMARLANQQAEIRDTAEKLNYGLGKRRYQSDDLMKALELMKRMEGDLRQGKGQDYSELQKRIVEKLEQVKKVVGAQLRSNQDASAYLPKQMQDELRSAMDEEAPAEYRDLIKDYYRSLSEGK